MVAWHRPWLAVVAGGVLLCEANKAMHLTDDMLTALQATCGSWWGHRKQLMNLTQACWSNVHDSSSDKPCRSDNIGPKRIVQMPSYVLR